MIEISELEKKYGDFAAVNKVSFSADKGEVVGFLGPNGAGKTTTIRMLATYLPPTSGTASIAGHDILREADDVRRKIGYLPENPPLYGEMRVSEYLQFVGELKGLRGKKLREACDEVLEKCFLTEESGKLCQNLSRGFRQRVGLAQAIIHNPDVIILDEPTSGLDPRQIIDIRKLIASLAEDHTVILSTHILPEVTMVCTKVVIISEGCIVLEKSLAEIGEDKSLEQVFLDCVSGQQQVEASVVLA